MMLVFKQVDLNPEKARTDNENRKIIERKKDTKLI